MAGFPSGTVTFLFTDIEESTSLWERDSAAARPIVERCLAIVRQSVQAHDGVHFKTIGDGTQSAFFTAPCGIAAALMAQRALRDEPWPVADNAPRVRMALHAGVAEPRDGDYLAPCLNRLARLMEAAHGEQILLSETVANLASDARPAGVSFAALGEIRLRDILQPEEVFQLQHPALRADFPPLNTPGRLPHNLPAHPTPFLGREREVDEIVALLQQPGVRLVTLTGPGGVGKTRLGMRVAAEALESFPDGAFIVDLARQTDPALIPSATASALGLREPAGQSLNETLVAYLRERRILLLFDNFEHVLEAASFVADLLAAAPEMTVLVTSRARLELQAEHEYRVETLPVPDAAALPPLEDVARYDAVALFVSRARALRPGFTLTAENARTIVAICDRVDGLPLAIELAAARIKLLTPDALLARLERRLPTLTGGARDRPARHRTLRDTIAWSHELLAPEEAALFRRLSIFAGGWTLEGAEAVGRLAGAGDDVLTGLSSLIDQSLVDQWPRPDDTEPRYGMLETIREFAGERLAESDEAEQVRRAFETFLIAFAEEAEHGLRGPEQMRWLDRLDAEHANIRAALAGIVERQDGAMALSLAPRLWEFWRTRGFLAEGRGWLEQALESAANEAPERRAAAEFALGKLAIDLGDYEAAERRFLAAAAVWESSANRCALADAKNALTIVKLNIGQFEEARTIGQDALNMSREMEDTRGTATALFNLGILEREDGHLTEGIALLDEALALWRALDDPKWIALTTGALGISHRRAGNPELANQFLTESGDITRKQNNPFWLAVITIERGLLAQDTGQYRQAIVLHADALRQFEAAGAPLGIIESIEWIAVALANDGQAIPALHLFAAASVARGVRQLPLMASEAPLIDAGLQNARARAGYEADVALAHGARLSLEQARDKALEMSRSKVTS